MNAEQTASLTSVLEGAGLAGSEYSTQEWQLLAVLADAAQSLSEMAQNAGGGTWDPVAFSAAQLVSCLRDTCASHSMAAEASAILAHWRVPEAWLAGPITDEVAAPLAR